ncbi:Peroxiredoxin [Stanieria cyanosphaera PCC 7437]|uniref:thioredoxin-dependent peroxiredoxin n=1 Tax=Stanieria cyanosphaera (strain ATCC 29371 / PCC 7437) TaxID=111780 RepID=K9Y0F9_STAC7|nr:thioredoxin-dependent thiol peroxidase [Stanieria cyanosphaera]AFZ37881.1 Peroxiredoxin [Stanieria cyanosphaera PCC 7437]
MPEIGQSAPNFTAKDQNGNLISLQDFANQWLVLYFYPKDNTPGCTSEAKEFSAYQNQFDQLNAKIVGVSPDSEISHGKFIDKHQLSIQLLSDPEHQIIDSYGVWRLKKFMGKEYMGVVRSTFLINPEGKIAYIWDKVRVKGHVEAVLKKLPANLD